MKTGYKAALLISALTLFSAEGILLHANSAMTHWEGTDSTGVVSTDSECPLTVIHEDLTFRISDFPAVHYSNPASFADYQSTVTAEYTFCNPSDLHVTAHLAFPFGNYPFYYPWNENDDNSPVTDTYTVTADGKDAGAVLRHTFHPVPYAAFDTEKDLQLLTEDFTSDPVYGPDAEMHEYIYEASFPSADGAMQEVVSEVSMPEGAVLILPVYMAASAGEEHMLIRSSCGSGKEIRFCILGKEPGEDPVFRFENNVPDGTVSLKEKNELTLGEYIYRDEDKLPDVSHTDYYNAYAAMIREQGSIVYDSGLSMSSLMGWYEYEIELDPGETLKNTVTAPLYPSVEQSYDPPVYEYTYLLSPASSWKEFGSLDIRIITPYFMTDQRDSAFVKTDAGYEMSSETLPEGELQFTMCTVPDPKKDSSGNLYLLVFLLPFLAAGTAVILLIILLAKLLKKMMNRK